jgi:nucleotide-binding universal stress UspA family protein
MVIAHATDLTGDDDAAFVHAAALAAASGARLVTVHGNPTASSPAKLPDAAVLAARWNRPIAHERRCHECCDDVADTVIDAMRHIAPQLVVLGTHARHGLAAFVRGSISEAIARNLTVPTLFVPNTIEGFVTSSTGAIDLRRVIIPSGSSSEAVRGSAAAAKLLALAGVGNASMEIMSVGEPIAERIVEAARERRVQLIVMTTGGHDSATDVLLGSHTERVLRDAPCAVLAVPA